LGGSNVIERLGEACSLCRDYRVVLAGGKAVELLQAGSSSISQPGLHLCLGGRGRSGCRRGHRANLPFGADAPFVGWVGQMSSAQ
jgi:hypothetical protein